MPLPPKLGKLLRYNQQQKSNYIPCNYLHYGSCYVRHFQLFCIVFFKALGFYVPVHLIPLFLNFKSLKKRYLIN